MWIAVFESLKKESKQTVETRGLKLSRMCVKPVAYCKDILDSHPSVDHEVTVGRYKLSIAISERLHFIYNLFAIFNHEPKNELIHGPWEHTIMGALSAKGCALDFQWLTTVLRLPYLMSRDSLHRLFSSGFPEPSSSSLCADALKFFPFCFLSPYKLVEGAQTLRATSASSTPAGAGGTQLRSAPVQPPRTVLPSADKECLQPICATVPSAAKKSVQYNRTSPSASYTSTGSALSPRAAAAAQAGVDAARTLCTPAASSTPAGVGATQLCSAVVTAACAVVTHSTCAAPVTPSWVGGVHSPSAAHANPVGGGARYAPQAAATTADGGGAHIQLAAPVPPADPGAAPTTSTHFATLAYLAHIPSAPVVTPDVGGTAVPPAAKKSVKPNCTAVSSTAKEFLQPPGGAVPSATTWRVQSFFPMERGLGQGSILAPLKWILSCSAVSPTVNERVQPPEAEPGTHSADPPLPD